MSTTKFTAITVGLLVAACGSEGNIQGTTDTPVVDGIDRDAIMIGQNLRFIGRNFISPEEGLTTITFNGVFEYTDPNGQLQIEPTNYTVSPFFDGTALSALNFGNFTAEAGANVLFLSRFGPFQNPFQNQDNNPLTRNNSPGVFRGTISAKNEFKDGTIQEGEFANEFTLEVMGSVLIRRLAPIVDLTENDQPVPATCVEPALRGLVGWPYVLEVEAMGFTPASWEYQIFEANKGQRSTPQELAAGDFITYAHPNATGQTDFIGGLDEPLFFNPLDPGQSMSFSTIYVKATDVNGQEFMTALPFPRVRGVQRIDRNRQLAEIYESTAESGKTQGGIGSAISFGQSSSETVQRAFTYSVGESEAQATGSATTSSMSESIGRVNSIGKSSSQSNSESVSESEGTVTGNSYATTSGQATSTSTSNGFSFAEAQAFTNSTSKTRNKFGVDAGFAFDIGGGSKFDIGGDAGISESETNSETNGSISATSDSQTNSFGSVTGEATATNSAQSSGLARSNSIGEATSVSEGSAESIAVTNANAQTTTQGTVFGASETFSDTFVEALSTSTMLGFSAGIPRNQCAVLYKQRFRFAQQSDIVVHDLCGQRTLLGQLVFNEFEWSPGVAYSEDCASSTFPPPPGPSPVCLVGCD